jgi:AAHS family 3-hydroxyphenylpropionic acid transporter
MSDVTVNQQQRFRTIVLCFLVAVLEGYDIQAIGVAAPRLAPALGLQPEELGLIFSISNIGLVIGALVGGWLADRLGRRTVLVGAVVTFGVFTIATLFVGGFIDLFAVRLLTGFGLGAALPNMMALAAEISTQEKRGSTTTMMFCGMPLGGGSSAWFVSMIDVDEWKVVFLVGGVLPLLLVPLLHFYLPNLRVTAAQAVERIGIIQGLFGDGRAIPTILLAIVYFPTLLILYLLLNWLPTLMMANGLPKSLGSQVSLAFNIGGIIGALLLGWILDRFGFRWPATICYVVLIAAMLALSGATEATQAIVFTCLAGIGLLGAQYGLYGVAVSYYPDQVKGLGSGYVVGIGRLGSIVGPMIAGIWLARGETAANVISSMVPYAVCAGVAVFALSFFAFAKERRG